jgi:hypothetical protein
MKRIKLIVILTLLGLVGAVISSSPQFLAKAEKDQVLTEVAKYKTWTKVSMEPIKVEFDTSSLEGG